MIKENAKLVQKAFAKPDTFISGKNRCAIFWKEDNVLRVSLYDMQCFYNLKKKRVVICAPWDTKTTRDFLNDCLPVAARIKKGCLEIQPLENVKLKVTGYLTEKLHKYVFCK